MEHQVSVIIPVRNGSNFIAEALDSIYRQTCPPSEVIVVDDGSTDGTAEFVRERFPSATVTGWSERRGIGPSRNRGVELATGNVLAFLDHDDIWLPDYLKAQLESLDANPLADMQFAGVEFFFTENIGDEVRQRILTQDQVVKGSYPSAMVIRREAFEFVGAFTDMSGGGEYFEWTIRAGRLGLRSNRVERALVRRRIHGANNGFGADFHREYLRLLKEHRDLSRALPPFNPVLQSIFDTETVTNAAGETVPLRANVDPANVRALQYALRQMQGRQVLEVGFAYGISSLAIGDVLKSMWRARHDVIDGFQDSLWQDIGLENMRRAGHEVHLHRELSEIALPKMMASGREYDFVFVDGYHTFDHALIDCFYSLRMLRVGGVLVLDDAQMPALTRLSAYLLNYPSLKRVELPTRFPMPDGSVLVNEFPERLLAVQKIDYDRRDWDWWAEF